MAGQAWAFQINLFLSLCIASKAGAEEAAAHTVIAHTYQINCWPLPTFNFYTILIGNFIEFPLEYSVDQREEGKFNFVSFTTLFAYHLL